MQLTRLERERLVPLFSCSSQNIWFFFTLNPTAYYFSMLSVIELFVFNATRFNEKPMRGIRFLQERGLLGEASTDVAQFLYTDQRLDKVCHLDF